MKKIIIFGTIFILILGMGFVQAISYSDSYRDSYGSGSSSGYRYSGADVAKSYSSDGNGGYSYHRTISYNREAKWISKNSYSKSYGYYENRNPYSSMRFYDDYDRTNYPASNWRYKETFYSSDYVKQNEEESYTDEYYYSPRINSDGYYNWRY